MADNDQIRDYLLGQLPETERLKVEEAYFFNPEALRSFWEDSNDLIDDYLRGGLSLRDCQKFEQHLHQLPAIREKIESDRALLQALGALPAATVNENAQRLDSPRRWTFSQWWTGLSLPAPLVAATTGFLLCIMAGGLWYATVSREQVEVATQATTNQELPSPAPEKIAPSDTPVNIPKPSTSPLPKSVPPAIKNQPVPMIATFLLPAEIVRGNEAVVKLPINPDVTILRLELELHSEAPRKLRGVLLASDGTIIKIWKSLPLLSQQNTPVTILNLSTASLPDADYIIRIFSSSELPVQEYRFHLEKK